MPLAHTLRPTSLAEFIGQPELVGPNGTIRKSIELGNIPSMIFWGPPSSGKTTLAEIIATTVEADFIRISAVMDGKDELRKVVDSSRKNELFQQKTILFIDEIHRWNKAQQDALLPYVESGQITLIGATTENPSFEIISALLSRTRVFVFQPHTPQQVFIGLHRGLHFLKKGEKYEIESAEKATEDLSKKPSKTPSKKTQKLIKLSKLEDEALQLLSQLANGDLRFALNSLELAFEISNGLLSASVIETATQKYLRYDKNGEEHHNIISAVHKSLRSSNPTAASYWICRMLAGGEDPIYIARRLVRFASEDIGNSSPTSLLLANAVFDTCKQLGMPECGVALVQLAEYLARAPKNNSAYVAYQKAMADVTAFGNLPVPMNIRNAPTKLMKEIGYGKGYEYDHDLPGKKSDQQLLPDQLGDRNYFG